jgi:hypothetical protein
MKREIIIVPSRDLQWFTKSLVLGSLFIFILVFEIAAMTVFGWLGIRGLLGLQSQPWIGTGAGLIGAIALGCIIPRQLPFIVGEIAGYYSLQIALDSAVLRLRWPFSALVRRINLSHSTVAGVIPFLPGMTFIMLQSEARLCFGSTLPHGEHLRLLGLIREALLTVSAPRPHDESTTEAKH